ncbi:MAG: IS5 family transposase [Saezia sp.]
MKPRQNASENPQRELFAKELESLIDLSHPMAKLSQQINWSAFDQEFGSSYSDKVGRPAINTRLMVSVHYLKYAFNLSDDDTLALWVENPYWQYFSGMVYFQHDLPMNSSSMTRWRQRVGEKGGEQLLKETINAGIHMKAIRPEQLKSIHVDTTVSEKNITYPTDAKLYYKSIIRLGKEAKLDELELRQTYKRVGKRVMLKSHQYAHARQMKRARKEVKRLKTYLGRLVRDIQRKGESGMSEKLKDELNLAKKLLQQNRGDKNKLYSLHEPHVRCISKGKAHKKYEFGNKVSIAVTTKANWVVGSYALEGNPYDGHTVTYTLDKVEQLTGYDIKEVFADRGYRGHDYQGNAQIHIDKQRRGRTLPSIWKKLKQRARIEPVIGHLKQENRMGINRLGGLLGDKVNAVLSGAGFNFRKLLRELWLVFQYLFFIAIRQDFFRALHLPR